MRKKIKLLPPPITPKSDVVNDFHGLMVPDPYRWLENADNPDVKCWTKAHNQRTRAFLDQLPDLEVIRERLTFLWNYPKIDSLHKSDQLFFLTKNDGLQDQSVLYKMEGLYGEAAVLLDPNNLSEDGTIALMQQSYSKDGSLLAYSLADSGSDWQTIHLIDTNSGKSFDETLRWCKFPGIAWSADNSGFYYNRLTEPQDLWQDNAILLSQVYWHSLNTPQSDDILIHHDPQDPVLRYLPLATEDNQYLLLYTSRGTDRRNGILIRHFDGQGGFKTLVKDGEAKFWFLGNQDSLFYFLTDLDAPLGRVIIVDVQNPDRNNWREVISEGEDALAEAALWGNHLVVVTFHHAHNRIRVYDLSGDLINEISLPTMGTVTLLEGHQDDSVIFFSFESFLYPQTIFQYDLNDGKMVPFQEQALDFKAKDYQTVQIFYPSKDGTRIPMFLTHKKGLKKDHQNPVILYGYGGFTLSQTPFFSVWNLAWLEMGGVFALANIRGGTEYGEAWHQAGMLENKQNVFDDFNTAAEYLLSEGYTSREKLAIEGRSNGGLLTSACMVQRPDLYGAVLCWVPVTDMLRYHKFTVGRFWTPEYGNAEENPAHFNFLYAYSPLHNLKEGVVYPPIIVTTGDTDDRVVPAHSKKFIARLLECSAGDGPHLLRIDLKAGHKLGKPTYKLINEHADVLAFTAYLMEMEPREGR